MSSISPSSSPRWDYRNSGFVSPSQLQLLKQQEFELQQQRLQQQQQHQDHEPFPAQNGQHTSAAHAEAPQQPGMFRTTSRPPQDAPAPTHGTQHTHSRTHSAFSFFKSKNHQSTPSTVSLSPQSAGELGELRNGAAQQPAPSASSTAPMSPAMPGPSSREQPPQTPNQPLNNSSAPVRTSIAGPPGPAPLPPLHPEIRSIVQLTAAHGSKIYFSGPLIRRFDRQPDGQRPTKDEGWREVWAQLGGTILSLWDMKEIEEASKEGRQAPPSYLNVTDAFVQVLGSVTMPATSTSAAQKYTNVLTLNTAGSNLLLFACPSTQALLSWAAALRLAAWEKSRLEEIYSAHLIRITLNDGRDMHTPLRDGRMEGWIRIRVAGQTDWKLLWMVISAGAHSSDAGVVELRSPSPTVLRKKRISSLFSRDQSPPRVPAPARPMLQLFMSNKPKDRREAVLTVRDVSQAFAVYPERPELISRSTLLKIEGMLGDEEVAGAMRNREGWLLVMPELKGNGARASEMLKWLIAIHDAFELYGRPQMYSWDPRDPGSMMFAYPIGPHKDLLFLDRELAENLDPRDDRTSSARAQLRHILWDRMRGSPDQSQSPATGAPTLPPLPDITLMGDIKNEGQILVERKSEEQQYAAAGSSQQASVSGGPLQLPPLQFEMSRDHDLPDIPPQLPRPLTPITERSDPRHSRSGSGEGAAAQPNSNGQVNGSLDHPQEEIKPITSFFGEPLVSSPVASSPPPTIQQFDFRKRQSEDSFTAGSPSRPDSKLTSFTPPKQPTSPSAVHTKFESNSSHSQSTEHGRQSPASLVQQRQFTITPPPPIQAAAKPSSRPASPRPSIPASQQSLFESQNAPPSPQFSVLTSPHSLADPQSPVSPITMRRGSRMSLMQDVFPSPTNTGQPRPSTPISAGMQSSFSTPTSQLAKSVRVPPSPPSPTPQAAPMEQTPSAASSTAPEPPSKDESSPEILREAGALYYMRLERGEVGPRRQLPPPPSEEKDETTSSESGSAYSPTPAATARSQGSWGPSRVTSPTATSPAIGSVSTASTSYFPPQPQPQVQSRGGSSSGHSTAKPGGARAIPSPDPGARASRRPSGARDLPISKTIAAAQRELQHSTPLPPSDIDEDDEDNMSDDDRTSEERGPRLLPPRLAKAEAESMHGNQHDAADMLAALSFLEREEAPMQPQPKLTQSPPPISPVPPAQHLAEPRATSPTPSIRSSFVPSRKAEERKAKSQAQQAAHDAAVHQPGRANGRRQKKARDAGAWGESSEEEEEEEDEEDEDADSDSDNRPPARGGRMGQRGFGSPHRSMQPAEHGVSPGAHPQEGSPSQPRRPRDLPQVPGQGQGYPPMGPGLSPMGKCSSEDHLAPQPRRFVSDQFSEGARRSFYPDTQRHQPSPQPQFRPQTEYIQPGAARQNMWSQVLERDPAAANPEPSRDTFIQMENPSHTMTKAFAPHGLLSAGLQDKQDRSAKRQEELARETGASLINVPNKPPPPQTGLLGAVTAHERERKREGGLGATLTERERERRLAEERQRKLDEFQRMQLDQMQQGGSIYGGMGVPQQFTGYNPMMMMGMNPMMAGGWGYPGMMNPQHMFAAQQAAQAYQQAMAVLSTAGSQAVGENGQVPPQMNPMMTGGMSFDPRMSMMGMPMMTPQMTGMGMGMGGMGTPPIGPMGPMGMGMGTGMGMGMGGMTPQMTGASAFDIRLPPGNEGGLRPAGEAAGSRPYSQNASTNGSPATAARQFDANVNGEEAAKKPPANVQ
ncbi:uncharacterized protein PHACADRAFT_90445 [Phanerochaete carnosa HHB-10118-sp]|uniref:PH domain-containing protein n=1 Tax=Phanerochaete carnosa (strain HHB-10118-sp) TaxID=650164 RepID=K5V6L9_PHACS|nr:uncharacterized protein PHACADRAFT_90445 [Phanerochaete carnosa HHB-10118-sp]EKM58341.1 hypothetical protein PHACADRAFT_90445 [Phanerochaete carnosa HHB-10118-sp]